MLLGSQVCQVLTVKLGQIYILWYVVGVCLGTGMERNLHLLQRFPLPINVFLTNFRLTQMPGGVVHLQGGT